MRNAADPSLEAQEARWQASYGEWQKAIETYNKALSKSPKDASYTAIAKLWRSVL
jgi:Flp pilus assembly protein TadD